MDHEIKTVTGGLRITVAYLLRRKDSLSASSFIPRAVESDEQATIVKQEFDMALGNEDFLPDGGTIGLPCTHLYTNTEVFPGESCASTTLTQKQINNLKGRDLMVASAASSFGLEVYLVPYLSHSSRCSDIGDLRLDKFPKKESCPSYMSEEDVKTFFEGHLPNESDDMHEDNQPYKDADVWILEYEDEDQAKVEVGSTDNYNYEGFYGNEASYTTFYVKAALYFDVPFYSESRRIQEDSGSPPGKKRTKK